MFVDYAKIIVASGKGGDGAATLHRAKFIPKGGPDGGDGGRGGDIVFLPDPQINTLIDFKYHRKFVAEDGQPGSKLNRSGKSGKSMTIRVPMGTVIKHAKTGEVLADLVAPGSSLVLLRGGHGGKGNVHLITPANRAPRKFTPGMHGVRLEIILELKTLADIGLVGLPNAGKSTLLSTVSAARPKIADYPFTTLEPQLGIVSYAQYRSFVLADIPGLIKGASAGKGLGHYFLRHIERTTALLFMIDSTDEDPAQTLQTLRSELEAHNPDLLKKNAHIVMTKTDLVKPPPPSNVIPWDHSISSVTNRGVKALIKDLGELVERHRTLERNIFTRENFRDDTLLNQLHTFGKMERPEENPDEDEDY